MFLMRKIITAAAALLLLAVPAFGQTPKTKSALTTEISTCFPDNITGAITPAVTRGCLLDFLASWQQFASVRAVASTPDTVTTSDYGRVVEYNSAGAVAVQLPQATGSFAAFSFYASNIGAGTVTISPISGTINGASNLALLTGEAAFIVSDGANWHIVRAGFNIGHLVGIVLPANGGTGINNGSSTITIGGNVVLAGAFTFTGTLTGTTAITFPTSGTLISSTTTVPAYTTKCNATGSTAAPTDCQSGFLHSIDFGAKGDLAAGTFTTTCTSGSPNVTLTGGAFTVADQGKMILVNGCGAAAAPLFTTITTVSSPTALILAANASTNVVTTSKTVAWATNDAAALQAWINACQAATSMVCFLDGRVHGIGSALSVTASITIMGAGQTASQIAVFSPTADGFTVNTTFNGGVFSNFAIVNYNVATAGAAISNTSPSGFNQLWQYSHMLIQNAWIGLSFANSAIYQIEATTIGSLSVGISTALTGDSAISDSVILPSGGTGISITSASASGGSGLKVSNTKISSVTAGSVGISLTANSCTTCSDLVLSNLSVEVVQTGITAAKGTGTSFVNITITGGNWQAVNPILLNEATAGTFGTIAVSGAVITPIGGVGVTVTAAKNFNITGNVVTGSAAATTGISVGASATGCVIGPNQFSGVVTNLADASLACTQSMTGVSATTGQLTYTATTWTPTLIGSTSGAFTLAAANGSYEKIGRQITLRFTISSSANAAVGNVQIGGLPVASANVAGDNGGCAITQVNGWTGAAGFTWLAGSIAANSSVVALVENGSTKAVQATPTGEFAAATTLVGQCTYHN